MEGRRTLGGAGERRWRERRRAAQWYFGVVISGPAEVNYDIRVLALCFASSTRTSPSATREFVGGAARNSLPLMFFFRI